MTDEYDPEYDEYDDEESYDGEEAQLAEIVAAAQDESHPGHEAALSALINYLGLELYEDEDEGEGDDLDQALVDELAFIQEREQRELSNREINDFLSNYQETGTPPSQAYEELALEGGTSTMKPIAPGTPRS